MAFIVEDGTGVTNANSYASVAFADTYFTERTIAGWTGTDAQKQAALIKATDYIESFDFKGVEAEEDQALSFPRDVFTLIPLNLQKATVEYALISLSSELQSNDVTAGDGKVLTYDETRVGSIMEKKQYTVTGRTRNKYPKADGLLKLFLRYSSTVVH